MIRKSDPVRVYLEYPHVFMAVGTSHLSGVERFIHSASTVVASVCFLGMLWLAVHIVAHPDGPKQVYRYYQGHLTNFVDPHVKSIVVRTGDGGFMYYYTVTNGSWGFQDIRQIALESGPAFADQPLPNWERSIVSMGLNRFGVLWEGAGSDETQTGIERGETQSGFTVRSFALPVIVQVHAGNNLHYDKYAGLSGDLSTPAGRRIVRWTIGPRRSLKVGGVYMLLGELVPLVYRAEELGWIFDTGLAEAIGRSLTMAAAAAKSGNEARAVAALERLIDIVESNAGIQLNEEAYALIVYNVEHAIVLLDR